jgi:hypothetical protein
MLASMSKHQRWREPSRSSRVSPMFVTSMRAPMGKARWTNLVRCEVTASPAHASALTASLRACWQTMLVGFARGDAGSDLITVVCRAGHESGLLVGEE